MATSQIFLNRGKDMNSESDAYLGSTLMLPVRSGRKKYYSTLLGSSGWFDNEINVRQNNRRTSSSILYIWRSHMVWDLKKGPK